jgi:hypothetical protein
MASDAYKHPEAINTLYFLLKNAYLDNDKNQANFLLNCMKKAVTTQPQEIILSGLNERQLKDLRHLFYAIQNDIYYMDFVPSDASDLINRVIPNVDSSFWYPEESELEAKLCEPEAFEMLNKKLGYNMKLYDIQYQTQYGRIDLLAKSDRIIYIIELKKDVANHKIIGQVLKYALYFQKRLIYNLYDEVKVITIAGNYSDYTYKQLKIIGATMMTYTIKDGVFDLSVI